MSSPWRAPSPPRRRPRKPAGPELPARLRPRTVEASQVRTIALGAALDDLRRNLERVRSRAPAQHSRAIVAFEVQLLDLAARIRSEGPS